MSVSVRWGPVATAVNGTVVARPARMWLGPGDDGTARRHRLEPSSPCRRVGRDRAVAGRMLSRGVGYRGARRLSGGAERVRRRGQGRQHPFRCCGRPEQECWARNDHPGGIRQTRTLTIPCGCRGAALAPAPPRAMQGRGFALVFAVHSARGYVRISRVAVPSRGQDQGAGDDH
jgi:hypothetical protein